MEVSVSKGLFSRRYNARPPRHQRAEELMSNAGLKACGLAQVKDQPGGPVLLEKSRPIHGACKACVVNSQAVIHRNYLALGSHSCFMLETMNSYNPFYVRMMPELFQFIQLPPHVCIPRPVCQEEVENAMLRMLDSGDLNSVVEENSEPLDSKKVCKFASTFAPIRFSDWLTNILIKISGWLLGKFFRTMFQAVCVHFGELEMIRVATDTGLPIIFVPLHRSNFDSFLISWTLFSQGLCRPEFVASHSLMKTPVLSWVAKLFGGLGCRERREDSDITHQCPEVNAALLLYFSLLWENGSSVILPVEPHRSRSGKPSSHLIGREFFRVLLKLYKDRRIEDAYIIPVSVNYEVLPEERLILKDDMLEVSPIRRLYDSLPSLWKNLGFTRVSFSQPFRLREFKFALSQGSNQVNSRDDDCLFPTTDSSMVILPGADFQWFEENGSVASVSSVYGETDYIESIDSDSAALNANILLGHTLFDASKSTVLMSTHLVAFLMTKKFKGSARMEELVYEVEILSNEIRDTYKQDIGFSGSMTDVVERAISLLGSDCIRKYRKKGKTVLKVQTKKSSLVKLQYYANHVMPLFIMQGIVAVALFNLMHPSLLAYSDISFRTHKFSFLESDLVNRAVRIAQFLKADFILHPPCQTLNTAIADTLEKMKDCGQLKFDSRRIYVEDDEDDYEYDRNDPEVITASRLRIFVNNSSETLNQLEFYRGLAIPYLVFYAVATQELKLLIPSKVEMESQYYGKEDIFLRKEIFNAVEKRVKEGIRSIEALVTIDMIRNFLNEMVAMDVIKFYANRETNWKKMYYLTPEFEATEAIDSISATLLSFCW